MCEFFGRANVRGEVSNSWKVLTTETYCHGFFFSRAMASYLTAMKDTKHHVI